MSRCGPARAPAPASPPLGRSQWYTCTMVWQYTCTNITLSQKQLEIQALRCNGDASGRCQHRRHSTSGTIWYGTYHGTIYGTTGTMVLEYVGGANCICNIAWHSTRVRTNITLSQKQLEIQALRYHGTRTMVPWYSSTYHGTIPGMVPKWYVRVELEPQL